MYIFVYVPAAGRIASATARNRAGPLPMQAPSGGGRARACGGRLNETITSSYQAMYYSYIYGPIKASINTKNCVACEAIHY